jgi:hypothetical protein
MADLITDDNMPIRLNTGPGGSIGAPVVTAPPSDDTQPVRTPTFLDKSHAQLPSDTRRGFWGGIGHDVALGTRDAVSGALSLPLQAVDALTWQNRALGNAFGDQTTAPIKAPSTMLDEWLDRFAKPETDNEKIRSEAIRAGAGVLSPMALGTAVPRLVGAVSPYIRPLIGTEPVASAPRAPAQIATGAAGGAAGEAAASSDTVPDWLKPTVRLGANVATAVGGGKVSDAVGKLYNMAQGYQTPIAQALDRLRIFPRTAGAVTEDANTRTLEAGMSKLPFAAGVLQPAQRDTAGQFHSAVEDTARLLGGEKTAQEAGGSVQSILQDWHANTFPKEQNAIWNPLNEKLAGAPVDDSFYRKALTDMAYPPRLSNMPATQQAYGSGMAKDWLDRLNSDLRGRNTPLTWDEAHAIKEQIGKAMGTPEIIDSMGMERLRSLYGGLSEGMKSTAEKAGLGQDFSVANKSTIDAHNFIEGTLSKAIKSRNPGQEMIDPDTAARSLLGSNTAMQDLRERVPQAADALGAYQLRQAALAKPGQQGATDTPSAGTFLTTLRKQQIERPEGMAALYNQPEVQSNLKDLLTVAGNIRETEKHMNTSGTGTALAAGQAATFIPRVLAAGYYGGVPGAVAQTTMDVAPYGAAKALTSPLAIRLAGTPPGPRQPLAPLAAGLLGYLAR